MHLSEENVNGVLEIKCPLWKCLEDGIKKGFLTSELKINPKCDYCYQIQGQMLICGTQCGNFVIYLHSVEILFCCRVEIDEKFCINMYYKLYTMYLNNVIPFLLIEKKENL